MLSECPSTPAADMPQANERVNSCTFGPSLNKCDNLHFRKIIKRNSRSDVTNPLCRERARRSRPPLHFLVQKLRVQRARFVTGEGGRKGARCDVKQATRIRHEGCENCGRGTFEKGLTQPFSECKGCLSLIPILPLALFA